MTNAIPTGREGFIPHLVCSPCTDAIEFYKSAFGAEVVSQVPAPDGQRLMHAEISIGGHLIFLVDDFPEFSEGNSQTATALGGSPVTIHRYVEDCDEAVKQAEKAGATIKMPPTDMFWGDRYATVMDPFGQKWSLATHQRDLSPEEIAQGMQEAFSQE